MRIPLRYQITEYDCATVALTNAISYLFRRREISPELVKKISLYTLDTYDSKGNLGKGGTTKKAIENISKWINRYSKTQDINIGSNYHKNEEVTLELIKECIANKGVVLLRTYQDSEHYVVITDIDDNNAYIFDSYYLKHNYYNKDKYIKIVSTEQFKYNRVVSIKRLNSKTKQDFAMGPIDNRECMCIYGKKRDDINE